MKETFRDLCGAEIGVRLKEGRQWLGLTQAALARQLGLTTGAAVKNYEKGQIPGPTILARYAVIFARSVDWLLTGATGKLYKEGGGGEGRAAEAPEVYLDPKRLRLVRAVKKLVLEANDDVIDALLKNVEVFSQIPPKPKKER